MNSKIAYPEIKISGAFRPDKIQEKGKSNRCDTHCSGSSWTSFKSKILKICAPLCCMGSDNDESMAEMPLEPQVEPKSIENNYTLKKKNEEGFLSQQENKSSNQNPSKANNLFDKLGVSKPITFIACILQLGGTSFMESELQTKLSTINSSPFKSLSQYWNAAYNKKESISSSTNSNIKLHLAARKYQTKPEKFNENSSISQVTSAIKATKAFSHLTQPKRALLKESNTGDKDIFKPRYPQLLSCRFTTLSKLAPINNSKSAPKGTHKPNHSENAELKDIKQSSELSDLSLSSQILYPESTTLSEISPIYDSELAIENILESKCFENEQAIIEGVKDFTEFPDLEETQIIYSDLIASSEVSPIYDSELKYESVLESKSSRNEQATIKEKKDNERVLDLSQQCTKFLFSDQKVITPSFCKFAQVSDMCSTEIPWVNFFCDNLDICIEDVQFKSKAFFPPTVTITIFEHEDKNLMNVFDTKNGTSKTLVKPQITNSCLENMLSLVNKNSCIKRLHLKLSKGIMDIKVLTHQLMLYDLYPPAHQTYLWKALERLVNEKVSLGELTPVHKVAAEKRIGDIRMHLIESSDIYVVTENHRWLHIVCEGFNCFLELPEVLHGKKFLKVDEATREDMLMSAETPDDILWITTLISTGSSMSHFPLHAYLEAKERQEFTKKNLLLFCKEDEFLYSDQENEDLLESFERVISEELSLLKSNEPSDISLKKRKRRKNCEKRILGTMMY
ncbi:UPF0300 family protein 5 [Schizosaccharomyces pombe]|uniref:Meiotic expression up-regulated protein 27 n=1 Tax=Schizosaccharomyces pombe (strain 972 / ATCC 24843) TaxID=284812 RepID=MEU27_SCHPO|nr:uncharacterized protein SPCC1259.14c [Schizosaccharomyces pombe]O94713.1 RecName: Full=Meiotic expression up-regulated protein 27 [Schizosaccharomyces pombe 972h-]CAA22552.1 S. pombe specific UPF0300 family protein 5 [Schizosaccharomyces pombe]|eukprot:NP_588071.1 uncharacterized protein SPCC1259.14c [Schizosaccharomyces pombe]